MASKRLSLFSIGMKGAQPKLTQTGDRGMENEKDRFGNKMRLMERAKEDIYFAAKDRELIEKLKARLEKLQAAPEHAVAPAWEKRDNGSAVPPGIGIG